MFGSRFPQMDWPLTITADWRPWQRQDLQRSRAGFKECTSRFPARSPYRDHRSPDGQRTGPRHVTFPNLRSGSQPVSRSKDLPSLWSPPLGFAPQDRSRRMAPLQTVARRENAPRPLDRFDPSLLSFDGTSHLHCSSSAALPLGSSRFTHPFQDGFPPL